MTGPDTLTGDLEQLDRVAGSIALHLRSSEVNRAVEVMRRVGDVVRRTVRDGVLPPRTSPVALLPGGPVVRIDDLPVDPLSRRRIADAVDDLVVEAGFPPGAAVVCGVDGLADLDVAPRAVVLRLFPEPAGSGGRLPATWIDLAAEWVFGDQDPETMVRLRVLGVETSVMAKEAAGILHGCARARAWCDVVTGDVASRLRTASISFGVAPHVAVAAGGPRCDDDGLLARFDLLAEVARDHIGSGRGRDRVAYGCLDLESTFGSLGTGLSGSPWEQNGGAPPNRVAGRLADRWVPDAYPYQVLGPRHVERLQAAGSAVHLDPVGEDRWALSFGDVEDWLPTSAVRDDVRASAWQSLAPLLLSEDELEGALAEASLEPPTGGDGDADDVAPWGAGLPDLSAVVVEPHSHPRRGTRLTILELAAWLAGEPHSDDPVNVSPVLRVYGRELAAGLDDERRQSLRHRAARLAGTGTFDDRTEHRRCWLLADRLLRVHAPSWLAAAGLRESAERLRGLSSIEDDTELVRGVHLLGGAVTTASRRLELSQRVAGGHGDAVEALAWDLWEEASLRGGGTATAEAVVHGVPGSLTFATDQRVMELSRDVEQRAELEGSTRSLGDEIWATALREVAAAGWRSGWDAAEAYVRHETTFSFRTTLRRSLQEAIGDDVARDLVVDDVDRAARDTIARLLLVGDDRSDHWDRAMAAAGGVDGGDVWRRALDDTCAVLGTALCEEALQTAREQVRRWIAAAPGLVSRAVVASVTREACSVAGRGLVSRIAADVLSAGGTEAEAEAAARDALAPIVDRLADDAVDALDQLVELA